MVQKFNGEEELPWRGERKQLALTTGCLPWKTAHVCSHASQLQLLKHPTESEPGSGSDSSEPGVTGSCTNKSQKKHFALWRIIVIQRWIKFIAPVCGIRRETEPSYLRKVFGYKISSALWCCVTGEGQKDTRNPELGKGKEKLDLLCKESHSVRVRRESATSKPTSRAKISMKAAGVGRFQLLCFAKVEQKHFQSKWIKGKHTILFH